MIGRGTTSTQPLKLPSLVLGVKRSAWRMDDEDALAADLEFARVRARVIRRDRYTCRYCAFQSSPDMDARGTSLKASGYLEVHHLDDDHGNNQEPNLVTVCPFCHMVHHVGFAGYRNLARIIWFPWLGQADLNLFVNCLAVASARGGECGEDAKSLLTFLGGFERASEAAFCGAASDASAVGSALMAIAGEDPLLYAQRAEGLSGLRLFPLSESFAQAVGWWAERTWHPGKGWVDSWEQVYANWVRS